MMFDTINNQNGMQPCSTLTAEGTTMSEVKQEDWLSYERNLSFLENKPVLHETTSFNFNNLSSSNNSSFSIVNCEVQSLSTDINSWPSTSSKEEQRSTTSFNSNSGDNNRESLHTPDFLVTPTVLAPAHGSSGLPTFPVNNPSTSAVPSGVNSFSNPLLVPNYFNVSYSPSTSAQASHHSNTLSLRTSSPFSTLHFGSSSVSRYPSPDNFVNEINLPQKSLLDERPSPTLPRPPSNFHTYDDSSIPNVAQTETIYSSPTPPLPSPGPSWGALDLTDKSDLLIEELPSTSTKSFNWKKQRLCTDLIPSSPEIEEIVRVRGNSVNKKRTSTSGAEEIVIDSDSDSSIIVLNNVPSSRKKRKIAPKMIHTSTQTDFKAWECPVCFYPSNGQEIVTTPCGHVFCKTCITEYMDEWYKVCPSCRTDLEGKNLITLFNI